MTMKWSFSYNFFVKFYGKKFVSHMTVLSKTLKCTWILLFFCMSKPKICIKLFCLCLMQHMHHTCMLHQIKTKQYQTNYKTYQFSCNNFQKSVVPESVGLSQEPLKIAFIQGIVKISWSFSYNSFVKFYGKKFGSHNATVLYPNLCYNKMCCKGTVL